MDGISVIIPTYNGAHRIVNVLNALASQSRKADEVVVVIDGSTDQTLQVVEQFKDKLPLKIVDIPNKGRAGARNKGVEESRYDLIVFLDDDMRPFINCLQDHFNHHKLKPGSMMVGHILEDPEIFTSDIQIYRLKLYARLGWDKKNTELKPLTEDGLFLAAANLSVSRLTFNRVNGFDSELRDAEDYDMGNRAFVMGIETYYIDGLAQAYHDDIITCKTYITRQREYIVSLKKLFKLKPELYSKRAAIVLAEPGVVKKIIYQIISHNFIVQLIDMEFFKYVLPEYFRYRFFDIVINGLIQIYPERKLS